MVPSIVCHREPIAVSAAVIQSVVIWLPGEIHCRIPIVCRSVALEGVFKNLNVIALVTKFID